MEKFNFGKVFLQEKVKKVEATTPEGMIAERDFSAKVKKYFETLDDVQEYQRAVKANFCYETGLTANQAVYKSRLLKSALNLFSKKFKIFSLTPIKNKGDQNKIVGFELQQLIISLDDEQKIKTILALQGEGIFSFLTGLTYEGLKAEVLSFEERKKEMIRAAETAREERERIKKVEDEIKAIENALITLKLHHLPIKGLTGKLESLRQSIAV